MARTSPTFRRRRLARTIKRLREQAGMTQERAAIGLDMSKSALSRKETGETAATVHEVRSMMDLYDSYDPDVLDLARAAKQKGWWRAYGVEDRGYVDLETEASWVRELSLMYIPGLLQTEDYMRAIFAAHRREHAKRCIEDDIAVRLIRQQRLGDDDYPVSLTALVDEAALRRPIGGAKVMGAQLKHVVDLIDCTDSVDIRVLAQNEKPHVGMEGAFILLSFPEPQDRDVLFVAYAAGAVHVEKEAEVREAGLVFDQLFAGALSAEASRELIGRAAEAFLSNSNEARSDVLD